MPRIRQRPLKLTWVPYVRPAEKLVHYRLRPPAPDGGVAPAGTPLAGVHGDEGNTTPKSFSLDDDPDDATSRSLSVAGDPDDATSRSLSVAGDQGDATPRSLSVDGEQKGAANMAVDGEQDGAQDGKQDGKQDGAADMAVDACVHSAVAPLAPYPPAPSMSAWTANQQSCYVVGADAISPMTSQPMWTDVQTWKPSVLQELGLPGAEMPPPRMHLQTIAQLPQPDGMIALGVQTGAESALPYQSTPNDHVYFAPPYPHTSFSMNGADALQPQCTPQTSPMEPPPPWPASTAQHAQRSSLTSWEAPATAVAAPSTSLLGMSQPQQMNASASYGDAHQFNMLASNSQPVAFNNPFPLKQPQPSTSQGGGNEPQPTLEDLVFGQLAQGIEQIKADRQLSWPSADGSRPPPDPTLAPPAPPRRMSADERKAASREACDELIRCLDLEWTAIRRARAPSLTSSQGTWAPGSQLPTPSSQIANPMHEAAGVQWTSNQPLCAPEQMMVANQPLCAPEQMIVTNQPLCAPEQMMVAGPVLDHQNYPQAEPTWVFNGICGFTPPDGAGPYHNSKMISGIEYYAPAHLRGL